MNVKAHDPSSLSGLVDLDWASNSSHHKSVAGISIQIVGGTVLYKIKYYDTVAEFIAAAEVGKCILFLRNTLDQIGLEQERATILCKDYQEAMLKNKGHQYKTFRPSTMCRKGSNQL